DVAQVFEMAVVHALVEALAHLRVIYNRLHRVLRILFQQTLDFLLVKPCRPLLPLLNTHP
ncbi:MAG: hypothetical protein MK237_10355, partial [Gemmatimonadetes bacterium]|nr:hypothetical protein [Gemmatimonadota bacterium]